MADDRVVSYGYFYDGVTRKFVVQRHDTRTVAMYDTAEDAAAYVDRRRRDGKVV